MQIEPLIFARLDKLNPAEKVARFAARLPGALERSFDRWQLELESWAAHGDYSAVAFCRRAGERCVLKLPLEPEVCAVEAFALRHWQGQGAVRLLDESEEALLLEAADPGTHLAELAVEERAVRAAEALKALHQRPAPVEAKSLAGHLEHHRQAFQPLVGQEASAEQLELLSALVARLLADSPPEALLHGDPHSDNLLLSERGCLAVDPLPLRGDGGYDLAYWALIDRRLNRGQEVRERLELSGAAYGYPQDRLSAWAYVVACGKLVNAHWLGDEARSVRMASYLDESEAEARRALKGLRA